MKDRGCGSCELCTMSPLQHITHILFQNLTGGKKDGLFITDVTNASRTMLMNIESLQWDPVLCR